MCDAGHAQWLFTDSQACYVGPDARLRQCICPLTTCTLSGDGYTCSLTTSMVVVAVFLFLIWIVAVASYFLFSHHLIQLEQEAATHQVVQLRGNYFAEKLFGPNATPTAEVEVSPAPTK